MNSRQFREVWTRRALLPLALAAALVAARVRAVDTPPAPDPLQLGRAALEDGLYAVAEKEFRACLDGLKHGDPRRDGVGALLARALYGENKFEEMLGVIPAETRSGEGVYLRALAHYGLGRYGEAAALLVNFEQRFAQDPLMPEVLRLRARCHLQRGEVEKAIAVFADLDRSHGGSPWADENRLDWARALITVDRLDESRSILGRLTNQTVATGQRLEALYWLGQIANHAGQWAEAEQALRGITQTSNAPPPHLSRAWTALAETYESRADHASAASALGQAITNATEQATIDRLSVLLGQILLKMGRVEEGAERLRPFIAASTDNPLAGSLQLDLADALLAAGQPARAAEEYQHYLETFTDEEGAARAHEGKGWALLKLEGRYAEAAAEFERAGALFTSPADKERNLFKMGDAHFANKQHALASEAYRAFVQTYPESPLRATAEFQLAECLVQAGRTNEAQQAFEQLAETHADDPLAGQALLRMAEIEQAQHVPAQAVVYYDKVLASTTNAALLVRALHQRGLALYQVYRFQDALDSFERVRKDFADSVYAEYASFMSGCCHYMLSRYDAAMAAWKEVVDRWPESPWAPEALFWMGKHYWNMKQYESAEAAFLKVVALNPKAPLARYALLRAGRTALELKEFQRVVEHLGQFAKDYPDDQELMPEARFLQAEACAEKAQFADAILIFDEIIHKYPQHALVDRAWRRKGDCQFSLGAVDRPRLEEAILSYKIVIASPLAPLDLVLHAEYMVGRCLEQMERPDEAIAQYHAAVVRFLDARSRGVWPNDEAKRCFARACLNGADLLIAQERWPEAVQILQRLADAGGEASAAARQRIEDIRAQRWWLPL